MFRNKYLLLAVLSINLACSVCYSNYKQFEGFGPLHPQENRSSSKSQHVAFDENTIATTEPVSALPKQNQNLPASEVNQTTRKINSKQFKIKCSDNEMLQSIGPYVIPTQRDLLLFTQRTLLKKFNNYHEKILFLLKDIKEVARSTVALAKKCHGKAKKLFKKCVKQVTKVSVNIAKKSIQSLERQEAEIIALTEDKICNLTSTYANPIQQVKLVAMDEAVLEFALPAFLRLLGGCTVHCNNEPSSPDHDPRLRKVTDQDLRKILTGKKYLHFLKNIKI